MARENREAQTKRSDDYFLREVIYEILRDRRKFPSPNHCFTALLQKVGALAQALLNARETGSAAWRESIWAESVQVAALAYRVAVDGDRSLGWKDAPDEAADA